MAESHGGYELRENQHNPGTSLLWVSPLVLYLYLSKYANLTMRTLYYLYLPLRCDEGLLKPARASSRWVSPILAAVGGSPGEEEYGLHAVIQS